MATNKTGVSASPRGSRARSSIMLAATVMLIASVCGAVAVSGYEDESNAAATTEEQQAESEAKCAIQSCKVGGAEVCGTDGKTYLNECYFQNAQCKNATLDSVKDWKGYNCPNTCKKKKACSEEGVHLCASDGNVYYGYCNLYIAQCLDASVKEVECDKAIFETN